MLDNSTKACHECCLVGIHCRRVYVHAGTQAQWVTANCRIWSAGWPPGENWGWVSIEVLSGGWEDNTSQPAARSGSPEQPKKQWRKGSQIRHPSVQSRTCRTVFFILLPVFFLSWVVFKSFHFFLSLLFSQTAQLEARGMPLSQSLSGI